MWIDNGSAALPAQLPPPSLLPHLSFATSLTKHLGSSSIDIDKGEGCSKDGPRIAQDLAASLVTASIKHIAFARGLISTTVVQLEKERSAELTSHFDEDGQGMRRSMSSKAYKRDQLLSAISMANTHLLSAIRSSALDSDVDLPLLIVVGSSPLSPKEIYHINLQFPRLTPSTNSSEIPQKLFSNLERQLIRFFISTEEISEVIMGSPIGGTGSKMSLFLFTLRTSRWRADGWRVRRGLKFDLDGLRVVRPQQEDEDEGTEEAAADATEAKLNPSTGPPVDGTPQRSPSRRSCPSTPASHTSLASGQTDSPGSSDLNRLAEVLSPARRNDGAARPRLVARKSSYTDSRDPRSLTEPHLTHVSHRSGNENVDPRPPCKAGQDPDTDWLLVQPLQSLSLDPRPPGSRLFPPNLNRATSLLARSRMGSSSSSATSRTSSSSSSSLPQKRNSDGIATRCSGEEMHEQGSRMKMAPSQLVRRRNRGRPPPRGAAFVLDCSLHSSTHNHEGEGEEEKRETQKDDDGDELVLFQCEVSIPSYHF